MSKIQSYNQDGIKKKSFEIIKDKNGGIHQIKGISRNNNTNTYNIEEHIIKKQNDKIEDQYRTFKIKSSDIKNLLKESKKSNNLVVKTQQKSNDVKPKEKVMKVENKKKPEGKIMKVETKKKPEGKVMKVENNTIKKIEIKPKSDKKIKNTISKLKVEKPKKKNMNISLEK